MLFYAGPAGSAITTGHGVADDGGGAGLPAGMVAVRAGDVRFPGRGGPDGTGRDSGLVVAGGGGLASGEVAVFCRPVTAAPVLVRCRGPGCGR